MAAKGDLTLMELMRRYPDEESARKYFESTRWPKGPECSHCGNADHIYKIKPNRSKKIRPGLYRCGTCAKDFSVTVNTVMESSHFPLHKWLLAFYMMAASKTQVSALQLQRQLEIGSYRSAWFMCHRIRHALKESTPTDKMHGTVEADSTLIGERKRGNGRGYVKNKTPVVSLVERGGRVRSTAMGRVTTPAMGRLLRKNVGPSSILNTDEAPVYSRIGVAFKAHDMVNHSEDEYARRDPETGRLATINAAEGFFGNAKRSISGTHHHVSAKYLPLYLSEIDHKYNLRNSTDGERTVVAMRAAPGSRLTLTEPKVRRKPRR